MKTLLTYFASWSLFFAVTGVADDKLRIATFDVDASPPVGSPLAYDPTKEVTTPLSCRGMVLIGAEQPIVLCAIDWLGVANEAHDEFRERLATAAGTSVDRVTVHALHQHDAPRCDFSSERILAEAGYAGVSYDERFLRSVMVRAADALSSSLGNAMPVTHVGTGQAEVHEVASNRRILGDDGNVKVTRYTACRDPEVRAMPVGTIDPMLKIVSFHNGSETLAVLTYYATHPQSYYRTGQANPDFPGMARNARQDATGVPHIHFNGAGGNIGAGKWNDGSTENRQVLADKVADGMKRAWESLSKRPVTAGDLRWKTNDVILPIGEHLVEEPLQAILNDPAASVPARLTAAKHLAWLRRTSSGSPVTVSLLAVGDAAILHLPGELFVEYQLAAQAMAPDNFVAMAAYGEYGPGYIGTEIAYSQGGYEASPGASRVSPAVEDVLITAMRSLLLRE